MVNARDYHSMHYSEYDYSIIYITPLRKLRSPIRKRTKPQRPMPMKNAATDMNTTGPVPVIKELEKPPVKGRELRFR